MSRTIRSEVFFNELAAAARSTYAHTTAAERAALRGATVRRESRHAAVRNTGNTYRQAGTVLANVLFSVVLGVAGAASLFLTLAA